MPSAPAAASRSIVKGWDQTGRGRRFKGRWCGLRGRAAGCIESCRCRASHPTFDAYCRERWGWSRQYGYRLMDAAKVSTIVDNPPDNPEQARELVPLARQDEHQAVELWHFSHWAAPVVGPRRISRSGSGSRAASRRRRAVRSWTPSSAANSGTRSTAKLSVDRRSPPRSSRTPFL
jgi:hypothetical protein